MNHIPWSVCGLRLVMMWSTDCWFCSLQSKRRVVSRYDHLSAASYLTVLLDLDACFLWMSDLEQLFTNITVKVVVARSAWFLLLVFDDCLPSGSGALTLLWNNNIWKGKNMKTHGSKHSKMFNSWTCLVMFIARWCCLRLAIAVSLGERCWSRWKTIYHLLSTTFVHAEVTVMIRGTREKISRWRGKSVVKSQELGEFTLIIWILWHP